MEQKVSSYVQAHPPHLLKRIGTALELTKVFKRLGVWVQQSHMSRQVTCTYIYVCTYICSIHCPDVTQILCMYVCM